VERCLFSHPEGVDLVDHLWCECAADEAAIVSDVGRRLLLWETLHVASLDRRRHRQMSANEFSDVRDTIRPELRRRPAPGEGRFRQRWFEELDRVAGRVLEQDLLAAHAGDDVVAEEGAGCAQLFDKAARSDTSSENRFQPPGSGCVPSGIACPPPPSPLG
jgi:hypothetical protein